jgi:hypothetical protein
MDQAKTSRTGAERAEFNREIDRILSANDELIPSSGFLSAVMERVELEVAAPAPIPFPWNWALPGILTAIGVFGWGGYEIIHQGLLSAGAPASKAMIPFIVPLSAGKAGAVNLAEWMVMALGVSLLCWLFARRIAGRGGLL